MSIFNLFDTDKSLEKNGIVLDYGSFTITIARAGGANEAYEKRMSALAAPHRRQIQAGILPIEKQKEMLRLAYAQTVVKGWDESCAKEAGEFSTENCIKLFEKYPDLFDDIVEQATSSALFRKDVLEAGAKN